MTETRIGPKEAKLREQREARVAANKRLIDKTTKVKVKVKGIGKVVNIETAKRGRCRDDQAGSDEGGCS
jgi:hypothetical protein